MCKSYYYFNFAVEILTMKYSNDANDTLNRIFTRRIVICAILIVTGLAGLVYRYSILQLQHYEKYLQQANENRIKRIYTPPNRGYIYDRKGYVLADNKPIFTAVMIPSEVENPKKTLALLRPIFDLSEEDINDTLDRIKQTKKNHSNSPIAIKMGISDVQVAQFSERKPFFKGVSVQSKLTRFYPYDGLFAHVLGYVGRINADDMKKLDKALYAGTDLIGKLGLEAYYEDVLIGKPGYQEVEVNAKRQELRKLGKVDPVSGNNIYLSLDYGLQKYGYDLLGKQKGAIVAIDPRNGDVLAFVSNPSYDPNPFVSGISSRDYRYLQNDEKQPLYNRALQGQYPPASTIKPFASMGFLHYGTRNWNNTIHDPGYFVLPRTTHQFRDWKRGGHGVVNMKKSVVWSCDTYYYTSTHKVGVDKMHDWMTQFNFGKRTGIDLSNEKSGVYPSTQWKMATYNQKWQAGDTISTSIGQGYFLATPLQVANATAIMASKGQKITPHLLKRTEGAIKLKAINKPTGKVNFNGKKSDWDRMHDAMETTVRSGTASRIYTPAYRIAGKTGTAQVKSIAQGQRYNKASLAKKYWDHAWFSAFAPVDNPQIAIAVLVENGGGGSKVAAPIARKLLDYWMITRKTNPIVPPTRAELRAINEQKALEKKRIDAIRDAEEAKEKQARLVKQAQAKEEEKADAIRAKKVFQRRRALRKQGMTFPEDVSSLARKNARVYQRPFYLPMIEIHDMKNDHRLKSPMIINATSIPKQYRQMLAIQYAESSKLPKAPRVIRSTDVAHIDK